jgi:hypothetical protein
MRKIALLTLGIFFAAASFAQVQFEYGKPDELKGVTKIFLDTGADMKNRERMLKEFDAARKKNQLGALVILDSPEGAEVVLAFSSDRETYYAGSTTQPPASPGLASTSTPRYSSVDRGVGYVVVPKGENRARLLMSMKKSASMRWDKWPSVSVAREFIKAYRQANGLK